VTQPPHTMPVAELSNDRNELWTMNDYDEPHENIPMAKPPKKEHRGRQGKRPQGDRKWM